MRILLATDGSRHARRATCWLRDLSLPPDATVSVLTVATLDEPPRDAQTMTELRASVARKARHVAERAARMLGGRWRQVEVIVRDGDPRVEIMRVADEMRVGMIVLGARGLGRVKRFLHVLPPVVVRASRARAKSLGDKNQHAKADTLLQGAGATLEESRRSVERLIAAGDPAREIVKISKARAVDVVVLGARGLRALGRLLLGSVSEAVLHRADRPVIIVRE